MSIKLHDGLDTEALHRTFARNGYIQVRPALEPDCAQSLAAHLAGDVQWNLVFNQGGKHFDMAAAQADTLDAADKGRLMAAINAQAQQGFQYCYRNRPIFDEYLDRRDPRDPLHSLVAWLNEPEFLDFARKLTGQPDIRFADAQATCFEPGHFLTTHDDDAQGKQRRAAFVLNFTSGWRIDWGGHLLLHGDGGDIEYGLCPAFNALNVFSVPRAHSVGYVSPFAGGRRLAITGWLRAGEPGR